VYIDLDATEDDQIVVIEVTGKKEKSYIRLTDLLYGGLTSLAVIAHPPFGKIGLDTVTAESIHGGA
jgi:hypothetical protein